MPNLALAWSPQPKQKILVDCPYPEILFGGSRGGGKTNGVLGKYGLKASQYPSVNAIFFRKEMPQADDLIEEAKDIYCRIGATWHRQERLFRFPTGGRVRFRPLESDTDAEKYQGQNISDACVEEAGNYTSPSPIDKLFGCLRSKTGIPTQLILTANPGGVGQTWIKRRYIDPAPLGMTRLVRHLPDGKEHNFIYIPSRVSDNQKLLERDPSYITRLHLVGNPELVRAWLDGDWNVIQGAYFPEFNALNHILAPFSIPKHWQRIKAFDWGYNSKYCILYGAISTGKDDAGNEVPHEKGKIIIYREIVGSGEINKEIARKIKFYEQEETLTQSTADPAIFANQGGRSINSDFQDEGIYWTPADNDRISGWQQIRIRLKLNMIAFFANCKYIIETLPAQCISKTKPEDLDTEGDDHGADTLRYLCKLRNIPYDYKPETKREAGVFNVAEYIQRKKQERNRPTA
jgi:hypothetical protein